MELKRVLVGHQTVYLIVIIPFIFPAPASKREVYLKALQIRVVSNKV